MGGFISTNLLYSLMLHHGRVCLALVPLSVSELIKPLQVLRFLPANSLLPPWTLNPNRLDRAQNADEGVADPGTVMLHSRLHTHSPSSSDFWCAAMKH
ncbi:hypothetical protein C8F04DRAFT_1074044 [Mycena alexandri]|uniref:Secreted protein n=1 Tax=Mycena alexandri TaxID=1745969 RepID=A0AAD6X8P0_9AGAR|nr:hypothetical protein C8F04DRAFT_1074044 [Mycena alexandri]